MKAIGYFRIDQTDGLPISECRSRFEFYCNVNLHQAVTTIEGGFERDSPEHEHVTLIEYLEHNESGILVVVRSAYDLGQDLESAIRSLVIINRLGSEVACFDEEFPNLIQNAFKTYGEKGVSQIRSTRIKEAMASASLEGRAQGRSPYGYRVGPEGKLVADKGEESVIKLIFRLYTVEKIGLRLIARHLNSIDCKTRRGGNWNFVSIRDIIRNPVYMGTYTRFGMRRPKAHEAIILPNVFRSAQDITLGRRPISRINRSNPFVLSGLIYCSDCHNKMIGVTRRQSWKRKNGEKVSKIYRYYQCQSRNNQSRCSYHTWREEDLENHVFKELNQASLIDKVKPSITNTSDFTQIYKEKVGHAERRFRKACNRASRGEITIDILGQYLTELDTARTNLHKSDNEEYTINGKFNWYESSFQERRSYIEVNVMKILVGDDVKIVVR